MECGGSENSLGDCFPDKHASTADPNGASGARYTSAALSSFAEQTTKGGSTRKRWKSGLSRSPAATLVTRLFYRSCSTRSRLTKISVPSRQVAPTTPGNATRQSLPVVPPPFVRERVLRTLSARSSLPPCKNARLRKPTSLAAVARNEALRASKYLGRAIWRRWSGDHRRSRVEAKMNGYTALETEDIAT